MLSPARSLILALQPAHGIPAYVGAVADCTTSGTLCSGPGKLNGSAGSPTRNNGLALDAAPLSLACPSRTSPTSSRGRRIGITKAVELPWRLVWRTRNFLTSRFFDDQRHDGPFDRNGTLGIILNSIAQLCGCASAASSRRDAPEVLASTSLPRKEGVGKVRLARRPRSLRVRNE